MPQGFLPTQGGRASCRFRHCPVARYPPCTAGGETAAPSSRGPGCTCASSPGPALPPPRTACALPTPGTAATSEPRHGGEASARGRHGPLRAEAGEGAAGEGGVEPGGVGGVLGGAGHGVNLRPGLRREGGREREISYGGGIIKGRAWGGRERRAKRIAPTSAVETRTRARTERHPGGCHETTTDTRHPGGSLTLTRIKASRRLRRVRVSFGPSWRLRPPQARGRETRRAASDTPRRKRRGGRRWRGDSWPWGASGRP